MEEGEGVWLRVEEAERDTEEEGDTVVDTVTLPEGAREADSELAPVGERRVERDAAGVRVAGLAEALVRPVGVPPSRE